MLCYFGAEVAYRFSPTAENFKQLRHEATKMSSSQMQDELSLASFMNSLCKRRRIL